jgi:tRNA uridine 5-carboxymethylaminomethyl modification enzyme
MAALETVSQEAASTRIRIDHAPEELRTRLDPDGTKKSFLAVEILRRPDVSLEEAAILWPRLGETDAEVVNEAATRIRYEGYLRRQDELAARSKRLEDTPLPRDLDYGAVAGLSREVVEKLTKIAPFTLGQAARISGVTPAAASCLEIHLKKMGVL